MNCPCCGQPVDDAGLMMLKAMPLSGQERRMLDALIRTYPDGVSFEFLRSALYRGREEPASGFEVVKQVEMRLRKKLKPYGWTIPIAYKNGVHRLVRL